MSGHRYFCDLIGSHSEFYLNDEFDWCWWWRRQDVFILLIRVSYRFYWIVKQYYFIIYRIAYLFIYLVKYMWYSIYYIYNYWYIAGVIITYLFIYWSFYEDCVIWKYWAIIYMLYWFYAELTVDLQLLMMAIY